MADFFVNFSGRIFPGGLHAGRNFSGTVPIAEGSRKIFKIYFIRTIRPRLGDLKLHQYPGKRLPSEKVIIHPLKTPAGILVQRSPYRARLYLFSLNLLIMEVIIRKNAESGPE